MKRNKNILITASVALVLCVGTATPWVDLVPAIPVINTPQQQARQAPVKLAEESCNEANQRLLKAAQQGNIKAIKKAFDDGADVNAQNIAGNTPLHLAARSCNFNVAQYLIDTKAATINLDARNKHSHTPLYEAAGNGHRELVLLLIEKGALVDAEAKSGDTPLIHASYYNQEEVARVLLEKGANVNAQNGSGDSALHYAARYGYMNILKVLIDYGANVNIRGWMSHTPLHEAVKKNRINVVELLLSNKACVTIHDWWGHSPLDNAREQNLKDIEQLLLKSKAK